MLRGEGGPRGGPGGFGRFQVLVLRHRDEGEEATTNTAVLTGSFQRELLTVLAEIRVSTKARATARSAYAYAPAVGPEEKKTPPHPPLARRAFSNSSCRFGRWLTQAPHGGRARAVKGNAPASGFSKHLSTKISASGCVRNVLPQFGIPPHT